MIVLKQIFHEVGFKTKSRRKVVHDIEKVEKHCDRVTLSPIAIFLSVTAHKPSLLISLLPSAYNNLALNSCA